MGSQRERYNGSLDVLHGRAVATPLPDRDAEREFHRNMMCVADAQERKAAMLSDPNVPLSVAYDREMEGIVDVYRSRLRSVVGDD